MKRLIIVILLVVGVCLMGLGCEEVEDTSPAAPTTLEGKVAALEGKLGSLESKVGAIPNVSSDISALRNDLETLKGTVSQFQGELSTLSSRLSSLEVQLENLLDEGPGTSTNGDIEETTRWTLEAWTDYESYRQIDVELDHKRIDDDDNYIIYLLLFNEISNPKYGERGSYINLPTNPGLYDLYYDETNKDLLQWQGSSWTAIGLSAIYKPVRIEELVLNFKPKSGDRIKVNEDKTYLDSYSSPYFDWDMEFLNRDDGTCKRIEALADTRFDLPIPSEFYDSDPERPYPYELRLEFELVYAS